MVSIHRGSLVRMLPRAEYTHQSCRWRPPSAFRAGSRPSRRLCSSSCIRVARAEWAKECLTRGMAKLSNWYCNKYAVWLPGNCGGHDRARALQPPYRPVRHANALDCALWTCRVPRAGLSVAGTAQEGPLPHSLTALTVGIDAPA